MFLRIYNFMGPRPPKHHLYGTQMNIFTNYLMSELVDEYPLETLIYLF